MAEQTATTPGPAGEDTAPAARLMAALSGVLGSLEDLQDYLNGLVFAVMEAIDGLAGTRTILMIAHRLSSLRGADIVHALAKGRIVSSGPLPATPFLRAAEP